MTPGWMLFLLFAASAVSGADDVQGICEYGLLRYFGPLEEDGEEFGVPDEVSSSIPLQNVRSGSPASPNDLLVAGRRLTFRPEDWESAGHVATFVFKIYRENDEISAIKDVRMRAVNLKGNYRVYVSEDGVSWVKLAKESTNRLYLASSGCRKWCNGVAGRYVKLEIRGGSDVPVIKSVSILVCQAFEGARAPISLGSCNEYNPDMSHISSNVQLTSGSMDDVMKAKVTFDAADWEAKKDGGFIELSFKETIILKILYLGTNGIRSATLYTKDDEMADYDKSLRQPYESWEGGVAFRLTDVDDSRCSGVAGRFFKLILRGEDGAVPTVGDLYLVAVKP